MNVAGEQIFIGLTTSGLCAAGLARDVWLLSETRKGQRLARLCGTRRALWILRALLVVGVLFGLGLAGGIINPVRWSGTSSSERERNICLSRSDGSLCAGTTASIGVC
jgi:hypothetical protein